MVTLSLILYLDINFQLNPNKSSEYYILNSYDGLFYQLVEDKVISTQQINIVPQSHDERQESYGLSACIETLEWKIIVGAASDKFGGGKYVFYHKKSGKNKICRCCKLVNDIDGRDVGFVYPIVFGNSVVTVLPEDEYSENTQLQIWHLK